MAIKPNAKERIDMIAYLSFLSKSEIFPYFRIFSVTQNSPK